MDSLTVATIQPHELAGMVQCKNDKFLIVDSRTFCEYNTAHILDSVNVWSSKIRKKRLQQNSISVFDYLQQACQVALQERSLKEIVVYDQSAPNSTTIPSDSFLYVLLGKLCSAYEKVYLLTGGFLEFHTLYPELCEDCSQKASPLTSLSQPCMPVAKNGPTRILPFLFLGSQHDANNKQLLMEHNITYELNVSTSCPKPEFLQDSHFMRISVNDNFSEKLLPHFSDAFKFIDKVRELGGRVLVHCLAGISRSPTVAIAFVMKHLKLHYDEAYRYVKNRRPTISPNINFVGQLLELDRQVMGEGSIYRSPTAPLYFDKDSDMSCVDLLRSSSISSVESHLEKSYASRYETTATSPSTALASLSLFSSLKSGKYACEKASVISAKTPEFVCSYSMLSEENPRKTAEISDSMESSSSVTDSNSNQPESFSTTASINLEQEENLYDDSKSESTCVIEVMRDNEPSPVTYIYERNSEPMVVRETRVTIPLVEDDENTKEEPKVSNETIDIDPPPQNSEENNNVFNRVTSTPPIAPNNSGIATKCVDTKHLPRSYSSSETHLNTRRLLESQNHSGNPTETSYARKSFSSDEVGKGFLQSPSQPPPLSLGGILNRENITDFVPLQELARCDSWSTSGLGSEISDWDSLQDDNHSIMTDDTQGPFDAVFADVYPGDWIESPLKNTKKLTSSSSLKEQDFSETNKRIKVTDVRVNQRQSKRQHRNLYYTSSLTGVRSSSSKESLSSISTPRPISLPGVTGTYGSNLKAVDSNSNVDMGVEMDDCSDHDWQSEKEQETFQLENLRKIDSFGSESSSVNLKDEGEKSRQLKVHPSSVEKCKDSSSKLGKKLLLRRLSKGNSLEKLHLNEISFPKSSMDCKKVEETIVSPRLTPDAEKVIIPERKSSLEDRLKNWDSDFQRKVKNIQSNVSSWDTLGRGESKPSSVRDTMAGFHLAQELMQSMENLLENEINDIKRQASALSTKFGLNTVSPSSLSPAAAVRTNVNELQLRPGVIDPKTNRSTISFCPSLQQGIIRSGKLTNIHQSQSPSVVKFKSEKVPSSPFTRSGCTSSVRNKVAFLRAKSEPPDEGLYRVRSCPGIHQGEDESPKEECEEGSGPPKETFLRQTKPSSGIHKDSNRYSCGALDSLQSLMPSFESCPDISKLKRFFVDSSSSSNSSTHSSFNRLLQVS